MKTKTGYSESGKRKERRKSMELQKLVIDEQERIFLNGVEIPHILEYCLKNSVESQTAELTIKMHVAIDSIGKQENKEAKNQETTSCTSIVYTGYKNSGSRNSDTYTTGMY